ncbi:hypothetical protein AKG95_15485 [Janthinobacterium lividum]|uniref:Uncharacterized protein n=1 Tax=Janthinobacterium lividum TaxID=29581 RepID=A0A1S1UAQ4_9BURK|nr:hypothetical protein AKG95_15485 [Janthinobacterium lividum]
MEVILLLAKARFCSAHNFFSLKRSSGIPSNGYLSSTRKGFKRIENDRARCQAITEPRIVDDYSLADIDAVMRIKRAADNQVIANLQFVSSVGKILGLAVSVR